eukprot:375407-Amphidinium_carterae.1
MEPVSSACQQHQPHSRSCRSVRLQFKAFKQLNEQLVALALVCNIQGRPPKGIFRSLIWHREANFWVAVPIFELAYGQVPSLLQQGHSVASG